MEQQDGIKSFLSDVFKKEGKELDDNTLKTVLESYGNDYDSLVTDVAKKSGVKDIDVFKSEIYKSYGFTPEVPPQAQDNLGPFKGADLNDPRTKQNLERWKAEDATPQQMSNWAAQGARPSDIQQAAEPEKVITPEDITTAKAMLPEIDKLIEGVKVPQAKQPDIYQKNYGIYGGGVDLGNKEQNTAVTTKNTLNKARDYYEAVANGDANAASKFWSGFKTIDIENTLTLGIKGLANSIDIQKAAKNYSAGIATPEEETLLVAKAMLDEIQSVAQKDRAISVGTGLGEMAPWLAQFAVTGGIGTGVARAVTGTALTEKLAANAAAKLLGKPVAKLTIGEGARLVGGKMAGAAAQTAAQVPMMGQGTAERMTDRYQIGEEGLTQVSEGEGFGEAILRTYANNFLENLSERGVGDAADFLATKGINAFIGSKAFGKTYIADIINWTRRNPYIKLTNRTLGLNTPLSENVEEAFTGLTQPFVTEDNWKDIKGEIGKYFTGENLYRTFLTTAAMGAGMGGLQFPGQVYKTARSEQGRKFVQNAMDDRAQGVFYAAATANTVEERQKYFDEFIKLTGPTRKDLNPIMHYYQTVLSQIENGIDPRLNKKAIDDANAILDPVQREEAKLRIQKQYQTQLKVNEFGDSAGSVTTVQIGNTTQYVRNSKDLGVPGAIIFVKDSDGITRPVPSEKIANWTTQTADEVFTDMVAEEQLRQQQAKEYELVQLEAASWGIKPGATINTPFGEGTVVSINEDGTITAQDEAGQQAIVTLNEVQAAEINFQEQLDARIKAAQTRLEIPNSPDLPVTDDTEMTLAKLDNMEPVPNSFLQNASNELYEIYNNLEQMKYSDSRLYTIEQIESMQQYLGEEITKLENYAAEQSESGEFVNQAQAGETATTGAGQNNNEPVTTGATATEEEINLDELTPEEAFNELSKTDIESAQAVLEDEITAIRATAKKVRTQPAEKRSQKVEFIKQAVMLETEATRLETILNESKQKLAETANISEATTENIPETGQEPIVSQTETISSTEKSSQKEEPTSEVGEQKVETVAEEPYQESPTKGQPVEPAKDVKLRIVGKAGPEMAHKKDAITAAEKLVEEYGVPATIVHSSELPDAVKAAAKNKKVTAIAFYHNGMAYIISDNITSVAELKKSYLHEAVLHKGLDILFNKGPVTLLGKEYKTKNELLDEAYSRIDLPLIQELAKEYAKNFNFEDGKFSIIPNEETSKLTPEEVQATITGIQREVAEEVLARLNEMDKTPSRLEVLIDSLWKKIKKVAGLTSTQFTRTDLLTMLAEHRALVKQATGAGTYVVATGTKFRTTIPENVEVREMYGNWQVAFNGLVRHEFDTEKEAIEYAIRRYATEKEASDKDIKGINAFNLAIRRMTKSPGKYDNIKFRTGDKLPEGWSITKEDTDSYIVKTETGETIGKFRSDKLSEKEIESMVYQYNWAKIHRYRRSIEDQEEANKEVKFRNDAQKTQAFFNDVALGISDKYKPVRPWEPILPFNKKQEVYFDVYKKFTGNFDEHISTSIPAFREVQIKVGAAIVDMYKEGLVYDIGGSQGGFVKAITEESKGKIRSINLDPSEGMQITHEAIPTEGSTFVREAFFAGFEDGGITYETHKPKEKADVVHESMTFQFITPDRAEYIKEVKDNYLKDGGLFITEEKFKLTDMDQYRANEQKKNKDYKTRFYSPEQINAKQEEVLVGMAENQANYDLYKTELKEQFKYVGEYWDGGNFKGLVATNSKADYNKFLYKVGNTDTEFSEKNVKFRVIGETGAANLDKAEEATVRLDNLRIAKEMEAGKKKAGKIKLATGWERGADKKWRYETEDNPINYDILSILSAAEKGKYYVSASNDFVLSDQSGNKGVVINSKEVSFPLEQILGKDDYAFKAYPEMDGARVVFTDGLESTVYGNWDSANKIININKSKVILKKEVESIIAHEIQHAIQQIEGFAQGGSDEQFAQYDEQGKAELQKRLDEIDKEIESLLETDRADEIEGLEDERQQIEFELSSDEDTSFDSYRRLAGEVEARNVQNRMGIPLEDRRKWLLKETEDVKREDQIFIMEGMEQANAKFRTAPVFYSPTEKALGLIQQNKGTAEQFKAMLLKNGAKQAELDWMGWDEFAKANPTMTKADIQSWIDGNKVEVEEVTKVSGDKINPNTPYYAAVKEYAEKNGYYFDDRGVDGYSYILNEELNETIAEGFAEDIARELNLDVNEIEEEGTTKYSQYQLPGGENYKEVLLTMPNKAAIEEAKLEASRRSSGEMENFNFETLGYNDTRKVEKFISSHWDEPNILAHIRFNERTDSEGNKVLFIEEIQSDWAASNRKELSKLAEPDRIREHIKNIFGTELSSVMPFELMDTGVISMLHYNQVRKDIISRIPIDVMDILKSFNLSAEDVLSNSPVNLSPIPFEARRRVGLSLLNSMRDTGTLLRAKLLEGGSTGGDKNILSALKASDLSSSEIVSVLSPDSIYHDSIFLSASSGNVAPSGAIKPSALSGVAGGSSELNATMEASSDNSRKGTLSGTKSGSFGLAGLNEKLSTASLAKFLNWHNNLIKSSNVKSTMYKGGPFVDNTKDYVNISLRRMVRYAAENGFSRIAWTPGSVQAERYDLSKQVDEIVYFPALVDGEWGSYDITAMRDGTQILSGILTLKEIEDTYGKEIAQKVEKREGDNGSGLYSLTGENLKVGGSGMKAFYDVIVPNAAKDLGKKFGAKVEETNLPMSENKTDIYSITNNLTGNSVGGGYTLEKANAFIASRPDGDYSIKKESSALTPVQSLPITESMRTSALTEGMPMFRVAGTINEPIVGSMADKTWQQDGAKLYESYRAASEKYAKSDPEEDGDAFDAAGKAYREFKTALTAAYSAGNVPEEEANKYKLYIDKFVPVGNKTVYHVTVDGESVEKNGLRTKSEVLKAGGNTGLGGGEGISFTTDPEYAKKIYRYFKEMQDALNGKIDIADEFSKFGPKTQNSIIIGVRDTLGGEIEDIRKAIENNTATYEVTRPSFSLTKPNITKTVEVDKFIGNYYNIMSMYSTLGDREWMAASSDISGLKDGIVAIFESKTKPEAKGELYPAEREIRLFSGDAVTDTKRIDAGTRFRTKYVPDEVSRELTFDKEGNVMFVHYGKQQYDILDPQNASQNASNISSREELAAKSTVGGVIDLYTHPEQQEPGTGTFAHIIKADPDKVYHLQSDPLKLYDVAKSRFNEQFPGQAFTPNHQAAWVSKVANERGIDVVITDWRKGPIGKITKPMTPTEGKFGERPDRTPKTGDRIHVFGSEWDVTNVKDGIIYLEGEDGQRQLYAKNAGSIIGGFINKDNADEIKFRTNDSKDEWRLRAAAKREGDIRGVTIGQSENNARVSRTDEAYSRARERNVEVTDNEAAAIAAYANGEGITIDQALDVFDKGKKSGTIVVRNKINNAPVGSNVTPVFSTYNESVANVSQKTNVWVRNSESETNSDRIIAIQFTPVTSTRKTGFDKYYDLLYRFVPGYDRTSDFWEIPPWIARIAAMEPNTDTYIVRNMDEADAFIKEAGYGKVVFSAMDVTKPMIEKLVAGNKDVKFDIGTYAAFPEMDNYPNATTFKSIEDYAKVNNVPLKYSYDYRNFEGTAAIPRIRTSEGCHFACAFCSNTLKVKDLPLDEIMQQVEDIKYIDAKLVYVGDKAFGQAKNKDVLIDIYNRIKEYNPGFDGFIIQTSALDFANRRVFSPEFLQASHIKYVELGIETANDDILMKLKKPHSKRVYANMAMQNARDNDVTIIPNVIVGLAGTNKDGSKWEETEETYQNTLDWLSENKDIISHLNVYALAIYNNTEIADNVDAISESDSNENVVEKSFHSNPKVHQQAMDDFLKFGSQQIMDKYSDVKFRVKDAEIQTNTTPSEAQKESGNYRKGHVQFDGFDISIENPKGSIRSGETKVGKKWSVELPAAYGYFRGTVGKDKDHVDVFIGENPEADKIYVVDQLKNDGTFDEHKVMLGFNSISEARNTYLKAFEPGFLGLGAITRTDKKGLKEWFQNGDMNKTFAEPVKFRAQSPNPKVNALLNDIEALKKAGSTARGNKPPTSVNKDVQAAMDAAHGLKQMTFIDKIREWALEMKQMSQHFKYITQKEFPVVYNKLRIFESIPDIVKKEAFETVSNITKPILKDKEAYTAFERYVVLKDLIPDLEAQAAKGKVELRWGYKSIDEVRQDLANLQKYVDANPVLKKTIELRKAYMDEIRDALIQQGLLGEKAKEKESYFHRQVLMFMDEKTNNALSSKSSVRNKEQSFQKARKEEAMAEYNTNYLESEFEVIAKSIEQLRIKKLLNEIGKEVNIKDKLLAEAKKNGVKWTTLIPEGYVVWEPKSGTSPFKAATPAEKIVQNELQSLEGADELQKALNEVDKTRWVIPEAVAEQLNDMKASAKEPAPVKAMRFFNSSWKQWILMNPFRVLKYNLNNMSGDLDIVLAYNPSILKKKYAHNALKDLVSEMKGNGMSEDMKEAMEQGVIGSGLSIQEIPDINDEGIFRTLIGGENMITKYWTKTKDYTQLRENLLRLAAYKFFKEKMQAGEKLYGASNHNAIDAIKDPKEKAGKLARELMGDYGNLSLGGQWLRSHIYPFWSWMEVNSPRYFRLLQNLAYEKRAGVLGTLPAALAVKLTSRLMMLSAFVTLWNYLFFHDEDEELKRTGNRQLMLITGRREDGTVIAIRIQGAFSDVLSFVGLQDAPADIRDVAKGKATVGKKVKEGANALVNKFAQGAMPFEKNAFELFTGMSLYPDILNARPSRDRAEQALKMFSMDKLYNWATKKPMAGGKELANLITYEVNPGEAAYFLMRQKVSDYLEEQGVDKPSMGFTKKGNALYYYKKSLKMKDTKAANHWLAKYFKLGGTKKGMDDSIVKGLPLSSLGNYEPYFMQTLDDEDKEVLQIANNWYKETYYNASK